MKSALPYRASNSTSSGGFAEAARTAGFTSRPRMEAGATKAARFALFFYRLLRDQCELAQVVIIERTLSVGGLIQSECSGDLDFEGTGFDKPVDLVQGWRVVFAVVALEFNASTFFGNGLDAVRIGGASTRS